MEHKGVRKIIGETVLITGGAGFIGSAMIRRLLKSTTTRVINVDKLTYAGNLESLSSALPCDRYSFECLDICDATALREVFDKYKPRAVVHFAAESHVDRSIDGPAECLTTNVMGTFTLLQEALRYWRQGRGLVKGDFVFHHISTDEVFGSLGADGQFSESNAYRPNSPYSATKAASDHLVRAWHKTYGLPVITTNASNNYGPYQFPEKLIPLTILNAIEEKPIPVYGDGSNVRDWLYVQDHVEGILRVLEHGRIGETYNIGGACEVSNLQLVREICRVMDCYSKSRNRHSYAELITFVDDRPGHDFRYSLNIDKIRRELGWAPRENLRSGLEKTVLWYLANTEWCRLVRKKYQGNRLGLEAGKRGAG